MNKAKRIEELCRMLDQHHPHRRVEMLWPEKAKNTGEAEWREELHNLTKDLPSWFIPIEVRRHLDGYF